MSSPRGKGRPRLGQAEAIELAIREAAMAVLVEQGDAATVQAVADAAGLSRKSVYARYPSREALFGAILRDLLRTIRPLVHARHGAPARDLESFIAASVAAMMRPDARAVQRLLAADLKADESLRGELVRASRTMFVEPLEHILAEGVASGAFTIADVPWTAAAVLRLIFGEVMACAGPADGGEAAAQRLTRFVFAGVGAGIVAAAAD